MKNIPVLISESFFQTDRSKAIFIPSGNISFIPQYTFLLQIHDSPIYKFTNSINFENDLLTK